MNKQPSWLDNLVARILSGQLAVIAALILICVAATACAFRPSADSYWQSCAIEVAVGAVFFLALYLFRFDRLTPSVALWLVIGGFMLGFAGWGASQVRGVPLAAIASAFLLELASAAILFFLIDLVIRGLLLAAEKRNAALAKSVQATRQQAIETAKQAAFEGVYLIFAAIDAARTREEIDEGIARAKWEPNIPEPLWTTDDDSGWSIGRYLACADEDETQAESRRLGEEMRKRMLTPPE